MYALAAVASAPHCNSIRVSNPPRFSSPSIFRPLLPISLKKKKITTSVDGQLAGCALELLNLFLRLGAGAGWGYAHPSLSMGEGKNAPVSFSTGAMKLQQAFAATEGGSRHSSARGGSVAGSARSGRASPAPSGNFATSKPPLRDGAVEAPSRAARPPLAPSSAAGRDSANPQEPMGGSRRGTPLQAPTRELVGSRGSARSHGAAPGDALPESVSVPRPPSNRSQTGTAPGDALPESVSVARPPSNRSQMSGASLNDTALSAAGEEELMPPRRTLRRMFADPSHYQQDEFLHGMEEAPSSWKAEPSTRNTLFHTGFYRGAVHGYDDVRKQNAADREARSIARELPRNERLTVLTKHHFGREDPPSRGNGRKHFQVTGGIILAGPESVAPREPDMQGRRMKGLLSEGLVKPGKESVRDVFGHMFGYSVSDLYGSANNSDSHNAANAGQPHSASSAPDPTGTRPW